MSDALSPGDDCPVCEPSTLDTGTIQESNGPTAYVCDACGSRFKEDGSCQFSTLARSDPTRDRYGEKDPIATDQKRIDDHCNTYHGGEYPHRS